jgi:hypothetical protein
MNEALKEWDLDKKNESNKIIINNLRSALPSCTFSEQELLKLYDTAISTFQSGKCKNGKGFESVIENQLRVNSIPFVSQVAIDKCGRIIGTGTTVEGHAHTLDILIGADLIEHIKGKHISNYGVISCKTSVRERWNQDEWTFEHKPKLYILCTLSADYPNSAKFQENATRKIATSKPKQKDDRKYKLDLEDCLNEVVVNYILDTIFGNIDC